MEIQVRSSNRIKSFFILITIGYWIFVLNGGYDKYIDWIENDSIALAFDIFFFVSGLLWISLSLYVITQIITYNDQQLSKKTLFSKSSFSLQDVISVKVEIESWIVRITLVNAIDQKYRCVGIFLSKEKFQKIAKLTENKVNAAII